MSWERKQERRSEVEAIREEARLAAREGKSENAMPREYRRSMNEFQWINSFHRELKIIDNERAGDTPELRELLHDCRTKLQLYRNQHSGEYVGGVEFTELMRRIDEVLL